MSATLRLKIERMTAEGPGIGRPEGGGPVHFVPYTAPGDSIEAFVRQSKSGFVRASMTRLLSAGPGRVEPRCPLHYSPAMALRGDAPCGGCDWQHLNDEVQLESKRELVRDCLFRIAKLREPKVEPPLRSPSAWRYRNKVQVPFGTSGGRVVAGFYAPGSHQIVDFDDCLVQPEISVAIVKTVKRLAGELRWRPYDYDRNSGWLRHLFVRTNARGQALVALVTKTKDLPGEKRFLEALLKEHPAVIGVHQNVQPIKTTVVLGPRWKKIWGRRMIEERVGSIRLRVSPAAFLQVNTPACEVLYGVVRDFITRDGFRPKLLLDLYSGVGSIGLSLADLARTVVGVEEVRDAAQDAHDNARLNAITNAEFYAGGVEALLSKLERRLSSEPERSAAAVLDPPRAGCTKPVLKILRSPAFERVVYVSCNPATFARDADWLSRHGWTLERVQPVDLFPQTSHIETVGLFRRRRNRPTTT
ncbi:MAG: 23S rRNA (uracil(1939)-C(5))-methyltransferase RlmD [Elusimicrobia bacterium CG_4_9_14_3_um_filter_62_55]|nr:MAG: 23S rRNA (uracil(1939)-C(5))-methyltransferase RlmD [Elusimicrobia bacterium CG22_combo_CG10-13_8_21_14_all_63_91]PJB22922.1 MAG: 23S rRNA (uracil(1939)-C(5))-methyltransferase RlmD [Elusimicrobia bacterium CG_4_9_14_3_um_filter_62_55]